MDNQFERRDGYYFQTKGAFSWWPTSVNRGKPWPKEVPVLGPENFHGIVDTPGWADAANCPDTRHLAEWTGGFPHDKCFRVVETMRQAIKETTGRGIGGDYKIWMWEAKQPPATRAEVWNRTMEILGYCQ